MNFRQSHQWSTAFKTICKYLIWQTRKGKYFSSFSTVHSGSVQIFFFFKWKRPYWWDWSQLLIYKTINSREIIMAYYKLTKSNTSSFVLLVVHTPKMHRGKWNMPCTYSCMSLYFHMHKHSEADPHLALTRSGLWAICLDSKRLNRLSIHFIFIGC